MGIFSNPLGNGTRALGTESIHATLAPDRRHFSFPLNNYWGFMFNHTLCLYADYPLLFNGYDRSSYCTTNGYDPFNTHGYGLRARVDSEIETLWPRGERSKPPYHRFSHPMIPGKA